MRTRYFQHVEFEGSAIISRWAVHNRPQNFGSKVTVRDLHSIYRSPILYYQNILRRRMISVRWAN